MAKTHRIKSAEGRWLVPDTLDSGGWIPAPVLDAWSQAAAQGDAACSRAVELSKALPVPLDCMCDELWETVEGRPPKSHRVKWAGAPRMTWASAPGRATLMEASEAERRIAQARAAVELAGIVSKANAAAKALGFSAPPWAKARKLSAGVAELAKSSPDAFDPSVDLECKAAIALFADLGDRSGFVDRKGEAKSDIAEACLFPDMKAAKAFARHHAIFPRVFAVSVRAEVLGYGEFIGGPGSSQQLDAVMASRGRKELQAALAEARVEQLEAELTRRKAQASEEAGAASEPPKPRRPGL